MKKIAYLILFLATPCFAGEVITRINDKQVKIERTTEAILSYDDIQMNLDLLYAQSDDIQSRINELTKIQKQLEAKDLDESIKNASVNF